MEEVTNRYLADTSVETFATSDSSSITVLDGQVGEAAVQLQLMLDELGFSPAVLDRMSRTRALDGTQSADGQNVNVTWTYHPDDGLQMVFEVEP